MNSIKQYVVAVIALVASGMAQADAPFIDYQWTKSPDACLERAQSSLRSVGFKITVEGEIDVVGKNGDYKAVIACIDEGSDMAVFMVSGGVYEQVKQYAVMLKNNFLN